MTEVVEGMSLLSLEEPKTETSEVVEAMSLLSLEEPV